MAHSIYNFKFDTSNCESSEQEYELKHQMTRLYWANITSFFLQKGKSIKFMYWSDDIKDEYSGYPNSGYGIKKISTSDEHIFHEKVTEDIMIIHAPINGTVKNLLLNSMNEEHITISPFFHFDILCEQGISVFTSQDFGENVLMFLTNEDVTRLNELIDTSMLIRLPEDMTNNFS